MADTPALRKRVPWNKGLKGKQPWHNTSGLGKNIDYKKRGKTLSETRKGIVFSEEHRRNLSKAHIGVNAGEKCHLWRGGVTPLNHKIRNSTEYILWRTAVFMRDDYTCQECQVRGGDLQADHIKPFAYFPELRLAIDNGRTLCKPCHLKTDTWGHRGRNYKERMVQ